MPEVCYNSELPILYFLGAELFFSGSLSDLLDTIGLLAKHALFLRHDQPNFDHACVRLIDDELLYFLCINPYCYIDNSNAHGWTGGWTEIA
jgi:hypothetical protein